MPGENQTRPYQNRRHSTRLPGYDYTQPGAYFVTIVTRHRECLFGEVVKGDMKLNRFGDIVCRAWTDLPRHYSHVTLDAFICMPNHVHAIIFLQDDRRGGSVSGLDVPPDSEYAGKIPLPDENQTRPYTTNTRRLSEIIRALKSFSARRINLLRHTPGYPVWQRNYYDHIVRNEKELDEIRRYILNNPMRWDLDRENPLAAEEP